MKYLHCTLVLLFIVTLALTGCAGSSQQSMSTPTSIDQDFSSVAGVARIPLSQLSMPARPTNLPTILKSLEASSDGTLGYPTRQVFDFSVLLNDLESALLITGLGNLYLPENINKPVPAIVILHGSGGIKPGRENEYARLFTKNGMAAFVVDYYTPRGVTENTPYIQKALSVTEIDVLVDAYAALNFLSTHPSIDPQRIGVTGYSYGGMATRFALDSRVATILSPQGNRFAVHADFYGPCYQDLGHDETTGAPYLAVFGDQDNSVDPETCKSIHAAIKAAGGPVEIHLIEGAGHAWENSQPRKENDAPYVDGCRFSFDPVTGYSLVDGQEAPHAALGASLNERLRTRVRFIAHASHCYGRGYIVGRDEVTDARAKSILLKFLSDNL